MKFKFQESFITTRLVLLIWYCQWLVYITEAEVISCDRDPMVTESLNSLLYDPL